MSESVDSVVDEMAAEGSRTNSSWATRKAGEVPSATWRRARLGHSSPGSQRLSPAPSRNPCGVSTTSSARGCWPTGCSRREAPSCPTGGDAAEAVMPSSYTTILVKDHTRPPGTPPKDGTLPCRNPDSPAWNRPGGRSQNCRSSRPVCPEAGRTDRSRRRRSLRLLRCPRRCTGLR